MYDFHLLNTYIYKSLLLTNFIVSVRNKVTFCVLIENSVQIIFKHNIIISLLLFIKMNGYENT